MVYFSYISIHPFSKDPNSNVLEKLNRQEPEFEVHATWKEIYEKLFVDFSFTTFICSSINSIQSSISLDTLKIIFESFLIEDETSRAQRDTANYKFIVSEENKCSYDLNLVILKCFQSNLQWKLWNIFVDSGSYNFSDDIYSHNWIKLMLRRSDKLENTYLVVTLYQITLLLWLYKVK